MSMVESHSEGEHNNHRRQMEERELDKRADKKLEVENRDRCVERQEDRSPGK